MPLVHVAMDERNGVRICGQMRDLWKSEARLEMLDWKLALNEVEHGTTLEVPSEVITGESTVVPKES